MFAAWICTHGGVYFRLDMGACVVTCFGGRVFKFVVFVCLHCFHAVSSVTIPQLKSPDDAVGYCFVQVIAAFVFIYETLILCLHVCMLALVCVFVCGCACVC